MVGGLREAHGSQFSINTYQEPRRLPYQSKSRYFETIDLRLPVGATAAHVHDAVLLCYKDMMVREQISVDPVMDFYQAKVIQTGTEVCVLIDPLDCQAFSKAAIEKITLLPRQWMIVNEDPNEQPEGAAAAGLLIEVPAGNVGDQSKQPRGAAAAQPLKQGWFSGCLTFVKWIFSALWNWCFP